MSDRLLTVLTASPQANSGPSWTTVAVKPAAVPSSAPTARPLIPGLGVPSSASSTTTRSASLPVKPVAPTPAPVVAAVRPAAPVATASASSIIRSVAVNGVSSTRANGQQYDAENPPPPSGEFLKWCKDALQGLTVPSSESSFVLPTVELELTRR